MEAVVGLIGDIREAQTRGASDAELDLPRKLQRRSQFMLDFVEAEHQPTRSAVHSGSRPMRPFATWVVLGRTIAVHGC
jgi:hypothetical protein